MDLNDNETVERYADHLYKFEPLAANYVDGLFELLGRPPSFPEVVSVLKPAMAYFVERDKARLAMVENHGR
jgi:hypothetical protein